MIVIHIGMPKAGSTAIQQFLRDNDEALRRLSIDYPAVGRENVDDRLKHGDIKGQISGPNKHRKKKSDSIYDLIEHIRTGDCETTILSSEGFIRSPQEGIADLRDRLSEVDSKFRIILVIRHLLDSLPSAYAQQVKFGGRTDDFDSFFSQRMERGNLTHFTIAERWASVFGWTAISVRLLSAASLIGGDLITDFLFSSGLNADAPELTALSRPPRANESPGWKTLEATKAVFGGRSGLSPDHPLIKANLPTKRLERRAFGSLAAEVGGKFGWEMDRGLYMTRAQAVSCVETFNLWTNQLNGHLVDKLPPPLKLEERGFVERPFLPDVSHIEAGELQTFYDEWGARLVNSEPRGASQMSEKGQG